MNLQEWRRLQNEGEDADLPSGLTIKIKRVSMMDLAESGKIPQTIQPQFEKLMAMGNKVAEQMDLKTFTQFAGLITAVCDACIVDPDGLEAKELPYTDRLALFTWANEVNEELNFFRPEQA